MSLKAGDTITFKRTFTNEDVELFTKISGDEGVHHLTPDEQGVRVYTTVKGIYYIVGGQHTYVYN